jgi:hypothetical protein
MAFFCVA